MKQSAPTADALVGLRADIQKGLDDIESGRTSPFDPENIIKRGEERLKLQKAKKRS